jgi:hypothetical protein
MTTTRTRTAYHPCEELQMHLAVLKMRISQDERISTFHWLGLVREYIVPELSGPWGGPVFLMLYTRLRAVVAAQKELLVLAKNEEAALKAYLAQGIRGIKQCQEVSRWEALIQLMQFLATAKVEIDLAVV